MFAVRYHSRRTGATVDVIPNDEHGQVRAEALADMLDDRVKIVAITHVPTNSGSVNPAKKIGDVVCGCALVLTSEPDPGEDRCQKRG